MEKKEIDVKFIVGIVILLVIFGVVGGSFWNLVADRHRKTNRRKPVWKMKHKSYLCGSRRYTEGNGIRRYG